MPESDDPPDLNARLMLPALLVFVLGSAVQLRQDSLYSARVYALIGLLALVSIAWAAIKKGAKGRQSWCWRAAVLVLAPALLAFALTGMRASLFLQNSLAPALEGRDLTVTGVIAAMPQRNESGLRFRLDVEAAQDGTTAVVLPPRIYLGWYSGVVASSESGPDLQRQPTDVVAGERWRLSVRLKAPHGGSNPHGFDYEMWLWEQGLQATGYVRAGPRDTAPQRLSQTWLHPVEALRQRVRDAIFARVAERQTAGVIAALVVGDQNAIDRADWDVFRATGVAHLMSISGLHVTMFAWVAALLVGWLWRHSERLCLAYSAQVAAMLGGIVLAAAYATFSGGGVPAQRTILMLATVCLLRLSGRRWPWPHVWMLVCAVVVAWDPWALLQPGFWLSFVAVGVLFATDSGAKKQIDTWTNQQNDQQIPAKELQRGMGGSAARAAASVGAELSAGPSQGKLAPLGGSAARAAASVGALFHEQWVITLALTPLTLLLFGQVSVVGLVANVVAIPWVTLLVTPLAMLGTVFAPFWDVAGLAVRALAASLKFLASFPFASVSVAQAPLWAGVAGMAGGLLLALRLPISVRALGLPLLLPVLLWQAPRPTLGQFELLAADIGQGNAVLVRTAAHALIYDAGPRFSRESDAGHRVLVPLLRALDERVDTVVLSHRDSDHTGGAPAVLGMQPQATLLSSIEEGHEIQAVRKADRCEAGQRWNWDGVEFAVLHPQTADYAGASRPNALSCVLRISAGSHSALLVGDIELAQEARLVDAAGPPGNALKADVLLVPHHGSKTSSGEAFLDAVQPRLALVQAGYRNRFGHPAPTVMQRYAARGIAVFDSAHCGAATWQSTHPETVRCQRQEALRYWHHRVP